jgi:hypothetical protein
MNAVTFNRVLIGAIIFLILGSIASYYFLSQALSATDRATDQAAIDADLSKSNVERLKKLEGDLKNMEDTVKRAESIVAQSTAYQYQDQIVNDLNVYAKRAGVKILGFDFSSKSNTTTSTSGTSGSGGAAAAAKPAANAPKLTGAKTLSASVTLEGPMDFERLLKFLKAIEQNLTKMQVTSINITRDDKLDHLVNNPAIGLEIYVKN